MLREGIPRTRNPHACLTFGGPGLRVAAAQDLILGRFAWADPATGEVTNAQVAGGQLAFVASVGHTLPPWGTWQKAYFKCGLWYLRSGMGVTLYLRGDFSARFIDGALPGQRVYANDTDGSASVGGGSGYTATAWVTSFGCYPGELTVITPWAQPFNN